MGVNLIYFTPIMKHVTTTSDFFLVGIDVCVCVVFEWEETRDVFTTTVLLRHSGKSFGLTYMYIQMHKKNKIKKSKKVTFIQIYQATKHDTNSLPSSMLQDSRTLSQVCKSAVVGNHASG